ncbi:hypothetical protein ACJZ2D_006265 [Fusarium nematophilum]
MAAGLGAWGRPVQAGWRAHIHVTRYPNHAFFILTLRKLVHIVDPTDEVGGSIGDKSTTGLLRRLRDGHIKGTVFPHNYNSGKRGHRDFQIHGEHSALASRKLAVVAEQVSIFLTSDNTVIAFFENSADAAEAPIPTRLNSPSTILRQSCDASMVSQAIIDVIIDMAMPVQAAYSDAIGDIEMDVLTRPDLQQSKDLDIIACEIGKMRSFIQPIMNIINAMRDHKSVAPSMEQTTAEDLRDPTKGVIVTPLTYIYLGDVLDHCVLINDNLWQITKAADGMIDLIFNTITAY